MRHLFVEYVEREIPLENNFVTVSIKKRKGKRKQRATKYINSYTLVLSNCLHVGILKTVDIFISQSKLHVHVLQGGLCEMVMMFTYCLQQLVRVFQCSMYTSLDFYDLGHAANVIRKQQ